MRSERAGRGADDERGRRVPTKHGVPLDDVATGERLGDVERDERGERSLAQGVSARPRVPRFRGERGEEQDEPENPARPASGGA